MDLYKKLEETNISQIQKLYEFAVPFPHIYIDNFLPENFASDLEKQCREIIVQQNYSDGMQQKSKFSINDWSLMPNLLSETCTFFNSGKFINFLESITTVKALISDPHLEGGGIHQTFKGGFLKMHTDFSWNERIQLNRRINVLYYLNSTYKDEWGGDLLLSKCPSKEKECDMKSIKPIFNRLLIFNTNDKTFHGHPSPLNFPVSYPRTSLAFYYYTVKKRLPSETTRYKSTKTKYIPSKGTKFNLKDTNIKSRLGYLFRKYIPFM